MRPEVQSSISKEPLRAPLRAHSTQVVRAIALIAAVAFSTLAAAPVQAAAPMVKTQAPGYFRMMLGDFEVTALSDGFFDLGVDTVWKRLAAETDTAVARAST